MNQGKELGSTILGEDNSTWNILQLEKHLHNPFNTFFSSIFFCEQEMS